MLPSWLKQAEQGECFPLLLESSRPSDGQLLVVWIGKEKEAALLPVTVLVAEVGFEPTTFSDVPARLLDMTKAFVG